MLLNFNLNSLANAATVVVLTLGVAFVAKPDQKASAQLIGAGEGSITPLVNPLIRNNPADGSNRYIITGSGAGRNAFGTGDVDFASSDNDTGNFPNTVVINPFDIPVVVSFNIPGFNLELNALQACQIVNGTITNWSEVGGPHLPVKRVFRGDVSGINAGVQIGFINPTCNQIGFHINILNSDGTLNIPNPNDNDIVVSPPIDPFISGDDDNPDSYELGVVNAIANNPGAISTVSRSVANDAGLPLATFAGVPPGVSNFIIVSVSNYFIFRGNYNNATQGNAAKALCRFLLTKKTLNFAQQRGYLPPSDIQRTNPDLCNGIKGNLSMEKKVGTSGDSSPRKSSRRRRRNMNNG